MRVTMQFLSRCAIILVGIGGGVASAADDLEAMTAAVAKKWEAQRKGIVTAHFSVRLFRYSGTSYKQKIPSETFRALFDGKDARGVEAALTKFRGLWGEAVSKTSKPFWGVPIEIICEGIKWRNEWKKEPYSVYVFTGNERVQYEAGIRQTTILPGRTNLRGLSLETLCELPKEVAIKAILDSSKKRLQDGEIRVEAAKEKIHFDPATGFINLRVFSSPSRKRVMEARQLSPIQLEGGFILPLAKITVMYEGDTVKSVEVLLIDKAELNAAVPPESFVVSSPKGTTILDEREKKTDGIYPNRHVRDEVPDVVAFANAGEVKRIPELEAGRQRPQHRWLYALLTLPFVILIAWSLIRRWKSRVKNA